MNAIEIILHRSMPDDRSTIRTAGEELTSAALARLAVSQLRNQFEDGERIEVTEFSPLTEDSYTLKARIGAPRLSGVLRDDIPEAVEYFEERFSLSKAKYRFTDIEIESILVDNTRYQWIDLLDVRRDHWISSGKHVCTLSASEVLKATVKQVGDYAILEDNESSCLVVAKIDEDGMAQPIQGGLDALNDAEEVLREHIGALPTMSIKP